MTAPRESREEIASRPAIPGVLIAVLAAGFLVRVAYVVVQPASDPDFGRPMLDGAYYLAWAQSLAGGTGSPPGAFYLAPLYPFLLSMLLRIAGESFFTIYLLQHAIVVVTAALLALVARRAAGDAAAVATVVLVLAYQPLLFFASRPVGETVGIAWLALAIWLFPEPAKGRASRSFASGVASGLAALARPNLLLAPVLWIAWAVARRRRAQAALLAVGVAVAIAPVTLRNLLASRHIVPISANSGITLYHGNGPDAQGVFTPPAGFSGSVLTQREEATEICRRRTGREVDDVEADAWWGREAITSRLRDPVGTIVLVARRLALTLDNTEHAVDYAPFLDENPWRWSAPVPFAVLAGLAAAGVVLGSWRIPGLAATWGAILAAALTPIVFYVSSRYRLPMAVLLSVPAGVALARLRAGRRVGAALLGSACVLGSLLVPSGDLRRVETAAALANRSAGFKQEGDLEAAERDARRALDLDRLSVMARFNLGVVLVAKGRTSEAEAVYREALGLDPGHVGVAANLSALLIEKGENAEAVTMLRRALASGPGSVVAWTNLVVALVSSGNVSGAREAAAAARRAGFALDGELLDALNKAGGMRSP
jgi:hypothetical protein